MAINKIIAMIIPIIIAAINFFPFIFYSTGFELSAITIRVIILNAV